MIKSIKPIKNKIYVFKFDDKNIMRKINPKSYDADSFKYSILISLHYYDISFHPAKISKLKPYENKYNFIHITPTEFETNNSNISLTIYDENNKKYITQKMIVLIKHT